MGYGMIWYDINADKVNFEVFNQIKNKIIVIERNHGTLNWSEKLNFRALESIK